MSTEAMRASYDALCDSGWSSAYELHEATWQAATAAERERAALVCDGTQASFEERAQGSLGPYNEMSVGAQCCAAAIRSGK